MMCKILLIFATICIIDEIVLAATDKIVCYHGIWPTYRSGNRKFTVEDIDPTLCTHIVYAFVGIDNNGTVKHLDTDLDINQGNLVQFNALKLKNRNLTTLVAVAGSKDISTLFSVVAANATRRTNFIKSALNFALMWNFNGFDLDLAYLVQDGQYYSKKQNFAVIIKELKNEFKRRGLLVTATVTAADLDSSLLSLSNNLDIINVITYNYHKSFDGTTNQNASLYSSSHSKQNHELPITVDAAIRDWTEKGGDPQKITLGLKTYGTIYTLSNLNSNKVKAPVANGVLGYIDIVNLEKNSEWTSVWDDQQKISYINRENYWIVYDNLRSITNKVEHAKSLNLAGVMVWPIEMDDFKHDVKYPILRTVNNVLDVTTNNNINSEVISESEKVPILQGSATESVCTKEGYVRDPIDCGIYYYCLYYNDVFYPLQQKCSSGLHFDPDNLRCDYPYNVSC